MSRESTPPPGSPPDVPDEEAIRSAVAKLAKQLGPAVPGSATASSREPVQEQLRSPPAADMAMATTRRVTIKRPASDTTPSDDEDIWVVPGSAAATAETVASVTTKAAPTRVAPASSDGARPTFRLSRWLPGVAVVLLIALAASYWAGLPPWRGVDVGIPAAGPPTAARGGSSTDRPAASAPADRGAPQVPGASPAPEKPASKSEGARTSADPATPADAGTPTAPPQQAAAPGATTAAPGGITPSFDIVRIGPDGRGVIAGRAAPGSRVIVLDGDRELAVVEADSRGEWVVVIDPPLAPGARDIRLVQRQGSEVVARSDRTITVNVPASAAAGASSPKGATGPSSMPLIVSTPAAGGPSTVIQAPGGPDTLARSGKLVLGAVDYDDQGRMVATGQAPPGTTVRVYIDNRAVGDATAGPDGRWAVQPSDAIEPGKRTVRIDQLEPGGSVTSRLEVPFERVILARPGVVTIVRGDNLWSIARARYGDGLRYTVIYEANKNQIRDPNLIYPGQTFVIPKTLD